MSATPPAPPPLVGRDRELGILHHRLGEASAGHGSLVLISGEAGLGKTALASRLAREAMETGARPLVGHCYDRTETPPYGPWRELFARLDATSSPHGPPPDLVAGPSHEAFFTQVRDFLAALAARQPLVLTLEDLHWADPASLDLLRSLARALPTLPMLVVVTYRADELERHHPLHTLIPLLVREAPVERLALHPLDNAAARALVGDRYALPEDEAARLAAYLIERTEGNALFLTELLRSLEDEGVLQFDNGRWHLGELTFATVPLLLKQMIDTRLARLGDEADALLAIAAVIGHEVPLAVWGDVAAVDEEALLTVAERAEAAHLVAAWSGGDGIRFTHALIREVLYESIPALRRRRLHRQAGDALTALAAPDPDAVAYHLQRAGDERAATWLVRAGERAEEAYALVTAAERYQAAFTFLDARYGDPDERGWLRLLAASLRRYLDPDSALTWVEEAADLASEAGATSLAARAQALRGLLRCYRGELRAGMADMAAAADAVDRLPPGTGIMRRREQLIDRMANRGTLIEGLAYTGHFAEARAEGERYLARFEQAAQTQAEIGAYADVYNGLAIVYALQGDVPLARRAYTNGVAAYESIGHYQAALFLQQEELALAILPYRADDLLERERVADAAERAARRLLAEDARGDDADPRYARLPLLVLEGRWREARRIAATSDRLNLLEHLHFQQYVLGPLARGQGDAAGAWRAVEEAWPGGPATAPGDRFVPFALPMLQLATELALDAGDLAAARAWLDAHGRWLAFMGATLGQAEGQLLEAAWHHASGDPAQARAHAQQALRHATAPRQPLALLAVHRLLGTLAAEAGATEEANQHLAAALALADACHAPYERALTLLAQATLLIRRGDTAQAHPLIIEIRALCEPLEARFALDRADQLAAQLAPTMAPAPVHAPPRPALPATPAPAIPAGLSAREVEVLRLVAAGLSNAQIADQLFLSPRTIKAHVANIFGKIGVTNRAAATRFALDHHLT